MPPGGADERAAELEPVAARGLAPRDGQVAGQAALRGHQVVAGVVQPAVHQVVADGEEVAIGAIERAEVHGVGQGVGRVGQAAEPAQQLGRPGVAHARGDRAQALGADRDRRPRPPARSARRPGGSARSTIAERLAGASSASRIDAQRRARLPPSRTAGRRRPRLADRVQPGRRRRPARPARSPACSTSRSAQVAGGRGIRTRPARQVARAALDPTPARCPSRPGRPAAASSKADSRRPAREAPSHDSAARPNVSPSPWMTAGPKSGASAFSLRPCARRDAGSPAGCRCRPSRCTSAAAAGASRVWYQL